MFVFSFSLTLRVLLIQQLVYIYSQLYGRLNFAGVFLLFVYGITVLKAIFSVLFVAETAVNIKMYVYFCIGMMSKFKEIICPKL